MKRGRADRDKGLLKSVPGDRDRWVWISYSVVPRVRIRQSWK